MTDYTWPDDLAPYAVSFYLQAHSGGTESPFSRVTKVYVLSAPCWVCTMSFRGGYAGAGGLEAVGPRLDALLAKLGGRANRALLYDFRRPGMRAVGWPSSGAGNIAAALGATTMTITGLAPGTVVLAGDYIGGDGRPHIITDDATAGVDGTAAVLFEPPLAAAVADDKALFGNPTGAFRLVSDDAGDNGVAVGDAVNMTLSFVEDPYPLPAVVVPRPAGLFFDSSVGDTFTGAKISVPSDASLTTSASQIIFLQTGSDKNLNARVKDSSGSVLESAFTDIVLTATFTMRPFDVVSAKGITVGLAPNTNGLAQLFGGAIRSQGGGASFPINWSILNGAFLDIGSGATNTLAGGQEITLKVEFSGDQFKSTATYPSLSPDVVTETMVFTATSFQIPNMFSNLGVNFARADLTLTSLKVQALYADARFAFLGDSITEGKFAANFAGGYAALVRADYPGNVLICGASGAVTGDWATRTRPVVDMKPKYCFVMLGTNDDSMSVSLATIKANYTTIINALEAGGIIPIACAVPPKGSSQVPTFNTWLAAQGWRFVDTYTPLLGTGTSLNATYDHGDGIHPNAAGHAVLHTTIANYITSQAL